MSLPTPTASPTRPQPTPPQAPMPTWGQRGQQIAAIAMAACLAVMALCVFVNVVLRYGFDSGLAATEELSRLLFVWMVFIGALAAYPTGEHMAFTALMERFAKLPMVRRGVTVVIRLLVLLGASLVAWGAWQQVLVGLDSHSVVLQYPTALLPLPALICAGGIAVMALVQLLRAQPLEILHELDVE